MYVWGRLARVALTTKSRGPYLPGGESRLSFRCLPTDIDPNLHLNNARYLMLADLGRMDIFLRSGLLKLTRERNWAPMMGGVQAAFVREVPLWSRFDVVSTIETWSGSQVLGRHVFHLPGEKIGAVILTTAGVYDRTGRAFLDAGDVVRALGVERKPREPDAMEQAFLHSHGLMRSHAKAGG